MVMSLENKNFKAYCGVMRITFKEEGGIPGPPVDANVRAEPGGRPREESKKNKKRLSGLRLRVHPGIYI